MFSGFVRESMRVDGAEINIVRGGSGEPVLLLHGYPETHVCWHAAAPVLAREFTVVCADLRGCGDSSRPPSDADHSAYSKRVMAADQVEVMRQLGFEKFAVVGHDRGARVAHRLALDHADRVTKLALLDIVPTRTAFEMTDKEIAMAAFNWFFSAEEDDLPERLIGADRGFYLRWLIEHWAGSKDALDEAALAEYVRCFDAESIRATNEEFRAASSIDLEHDEADEDKKIVCPTLVLWSRTGMWSKYDILKIWRERAENVSGRALDCGHFLPEEKSEETAAALMRFLED